MKCQCEHENHFEDGLGHVYLAPEAGSARALYVGPICDECASMCLAEYLIGPATERQLGQRD